MRAEQPPETADIEWDKFVRVLDDLPRIGYSRGCDVPPISAVYFLFYGPHDLIYVGQTGSLSERLYLRYCAYLFRREAPPFTHYAYIECPEWMRLSLESYYIQTLRPRDNIQLGKVTVPYLMGLLCS